MRRLRFPRPETILRRLNREIRREQRIRRAAAASDNVALLFQAEERVRVLQTFREKAFGIPLRPYHANRNLFPRKECRS